MAELRMVPTQDASPAAPGPFASLDPCVHCGFCLQACPTYLATGDESDSPRGRIVLMRALERGEVPPSDPGLQQHLDACLGCRGCEPVCPAGVGYGRGLEAARALLAKERGFRPLARLMLGTFRTEAFWRPAFTLWRWLRDLGLTRRLAGTGRLGFGMAMMSSTAPARALGQAPAVPAATRGRVALFRGCVMDTLFTHVHEATRLTLAVNGYEVVEVPGQGCCGALHDHAGDHASAVTLAEANVRAFLETADFVVVNSAGCGALLKDYGHLLGTAEAAAFAAKVKDVSELLAAAGPVPGRPLDLDVVYDAPCHLQHAQRVHDAPLALLRAIPGLRLRLLPDSDKCCGSAGIYSLLEPALSRTVLDSKLASLAAATPRPAYVATGNPGCLMQIGGGLEAAGLPMRAVHPVELLAWSYTAG